MVFDLKCKDTTFFDAEIKKNKKLLQISNY